MPSVKAIIEHANETTEPEKAKPKHAAPLAIVMPRVAQERLLTGYLQHWQSVFERSTTGVVLDLARLNAYVSCQCKRCQGTGINGRPRDVQRITSVAKGGQYDTQPFRAAIDRLFQDCPECGGTGSKSWLQKSWHLEFSDCAPFAPTNSLDVNVGKGHEFSVKAPPDDTILTSYAIVSRRISRLPVEHQRALGCAFGPEGESWVNSSRGRVWAVTELTIAGAELVASDPMQSVNKSRMERITEIADIEDASAFKSAKRCALIARAVMQAGKRLAPAITAWNLVAGGE